jgi:hypothetical protein
LATLLVRVGGANSTSGTAFLERRLMSTESNRQGFRLSLDTWAVILALALALAVRANVLNKIPW